MRYLIIRNSKLDSERNPWRVIIIFTIRFLLAFTVVFYMIRLGVTAFVCIKTGELNLEDFAFHDYFIDSFNDGLYYCWLFGIGEWVMRKAKKFEEDKKKSKGTL